MFRPIAWDDFAARYLALYLPPQRQPATYREVRQVLREFGALPGFRRTSDLTVEAVGLWIGRNPGRSPARTASLLRCLRTASVFACHKGWLASNPFDFRAVGQWVRVPDRPPAGHRTQAEVAAVLARADAEAATGSWEAGRLQALVYVYAFVGLRKQEALHLERRDLDLRRRTLTIEPKPGWQPKTVKSAATLPIAPPAADVLRLWLPRCGSSWVFPGKRLAGPWTSGSPSAKAITQVKALGERAGVPGLTIQAFRKTIGTHAKRWGLSALDLKALLRHTNLETQKWYDAEDSEILRVGTDRIAFKSHA